MFKRVNLKYYGVGSDGVKFLQHKVYIAKIIHIVGFSLFIRFKLRQTEKKIMLKIKTE